MAAGQYVGMAPGEVVHDTLRDDTTHTQPSPRNDQMLWYQIHLKSGEDALFHNRMQVGKQLCTHIMTAKVTQNINTEKKSHAGPTPMDIDAWDVNIGKGAMLRPNSRRPWLMLSTWKEEALSS